MEHPFLLLYPNCRTMVIRPLPVGGCHALPCRVSCGGFRMDALVWFSYEVCRNGSRYYCPGASAPFFPDAVSVWVSRWRGPTTHVVIVFVA